MGGGSGAHSSGRSRSVSAMAAAEREWHARRILSPSMWVEVLLRTAGQGLLMLPEKAKAPCPKTPVAPKMRAQARTHSFQRPDWCPQQQRSAAME